MNALQDLPIIIGLDQMDAPQEQRTAVAVAASTALDLKKVNLTDVALAQFGDWRTALAEAQARLSGIAWNVSTPKGLADIKSVRQRESKEPRAEANKIADALASKLTKVSKEVRAEQAAIVAAWDKLAEPLTTIIDAREAELAEEARKEAEAKAERERIKQEALDAFNARLRTIRTYATRCQEPGMTAERIANGMKTLESFDVSDPVPARAVELADAQCRTMEDMRVIHAQATGREQEAARQEAIRAENERVARELAAERERIAAELAEIRRQADELEDAKKAAARDAQQAESKRIDLERDEIAAFRTSLAPMTNSEKIEAARGIVDDIIAADLLRSAVITYGPEVQKFAADVMEAIHPDDPDAAPPMTAEEMGAETVDRDDALTQMEDECQVIDPFGDELRALIAEARASRFPSQPKMGTEWWARFYALVELRAAQTA